MSIKLEDWQQRVVDELAELQTRAIALYAFVDSETYDTLELVEQAKLTTQAYFMSEYADVLKDRIDSFSGE